MPTYSDPQLMRDQEQSEAVARDRNRQLTGARYGVVFQPDAKPLLRLAVQQLMSCKHSGGAHHFAVTNEGLGLYISYNALECINNANLGFQLPEDL